MTLILNSFLMTIFGTLPRMVSTEHTVACPHIHGVLSHSHHNGNPPNHLVTIRLTANSDHFRSFFTSEPTWATQQGR